MTETYVAAAVLAEHPEYTYLTQVGALLVEGAVMGA